MKGKAMNKRSIKSFFLTLIGGLMILYPSISWAGIWYLPLPEDISHDGWRIDRVITYTDTIITIFFGLVVAALIYFMFRYRARKGHQAVYDKGDRPINVIVTICLGLTVFLSIDAVIEKMAFDDLKEVFWNFPKGDNVLKVEIMPQQFAWNFRYAGPDGKFATEDDIVAPINQMHVPVDVPVIIQMAPYDVVHAFYVPNLRIKQDATPGIVTQFWFKIKKEGTYDIACSALCGIGHTNMRGFLTVESKEKFDQWIAALQAESEGTDDQLWSEESPSGGVLSNWGWEWQSI